MVERVDPYRQLRFLLEIEDVVVAGFSHCDLPAARSSVVEYREGNEPPTPRKLPGLNRYGPLVLKTGVTDQSIELFEWRTLVERGQMEEARRAIAVTLLDATGQAAARWEFREAWPCQYEAPRLSATADEVAIERLVVANEGFARVEMGGSRERDDGDGGEDADGVDDEDGGDANDGNDGIDGGEPPIVGLPTGELPRVGWTPRGLGGSTRTERLGKEEAEEAPEET